MKQERNIDNLQDEQALLLYVLLDAITEEQTPSLLMVERILYFLRKFSNNQYFSAEVEKYACFYTGKAKEVLDPLEGKYIHYSASFDPTDVLAPIGVDLSYQPLIQKHIEQNAALKEIAQATISLLSGFYSEYLLEVLMAVEIAAKEMPLDKLDAEKIIQLWNSKKGFFIYNTEHIYKTIKHYRKHGKNTSV
ncbi:MAG: hypothetical protein RML94_00100 [Bacteroidia bacterium]|nr:hypothetical protein [Bacteroidia bacterium]